MLINKNNKWYFTYFKTEPELHICLTDVFSIVHPISFTYNDRYSESIVIAILDKQQIHIYCNKKIHNTIDIPSFIDVHQIIISHARYIDIVCVALKNDIFYYNYIIFDVGKQIGKWSHSTDMIENVESYKILNGNIIILKKDKTVYYLSMYDKIVELPDKLGIKFENIIGFSILEEFVWFQIVYYEICDCTVVYKKLVYNKETGLLHSKFDKTFIIKPNYINCHILIKYYDNSDMLFVEYNDMIIHYEHTKRHVWIPLNTMLKNNNENLFRWNNKFVDVKKNHIVFYNDEFTKLHTLCDYDMCLTNNGKYVAKWNPKYFGIYGDDIKNIIKYFLLLNKYIIEKQYKMPKYVYYIVFDYLIDFCLY